VTEPDAFREFVIRRSPAVGVGLDPHRNGACAQDADRAAYELDR
jgi:hypothetical protein